MRLLAPSLGSATQSVLYRRALVVTLARALDGDCRWSQTHANPCFRLAGQPGTSSRADLGNAAHSRCHPR